MPKYLAINYLSKLVEATRAQLDRMLLPLPNHLEFVNCYAHRGTLPPSTDYFTPWSSLRPEPLIMGPAAEQSYTTDMKKVNDLSIKDDLQELISAVDKGGGALETFSEEMNDSDVSCSSDVLFDQLIDEVSSSADCSEYTEEFLPYTLHHMAMLVLEDDTSDGQGHLVELLESPESPSFLPLLVQDIPRASALSQRLRPKPVSDPFLNHKGLEVSLSDILKRDRVFEATVIPDKDTCMMSDYREHFAKEEERGKEMLLESPLTSAAQLQLSPLYHSFGVENLEKEDIKGDEERQLEDIRSLSLGRGGDLLSLSQCMVGIQQKQCSFVDLNNIGLNDSGIETLLFESPIVSNISLFSAIEDVSSLELYPITPESESLKLLTPVEESMLKTKLFRQDNSFDNVANLKFQYPGIPDLASRVLSNDMVRELMDAVKPSPESFTGEFELSLTWDPVAFLIANMRTAVDHIRPVSVSSLMDVFSPSTSSSGGFELSLPLEEEVFVEEDLSCHVTSDGVDDDIIQIPYFNRSIFPSSTNPPVQNGYHGNQRSFKPTLPMKGARSVTCKTIIPANKDKTTRGLDSFLMLRRSHSSVSRQNVDHSPSTVAKSYADVTEGVTQSVPMNPRLVKPLLVKVPLSDCYIQLLDCIVQHCRPYLQSLQYYWSKSVRPVNDYFTASSINASSWDNSSCITFIMGDRRINSQSYENMEPGSQAYRSLLFLHLIAKVSSAIVYGTYYVGLSLLTEAVIHHGKDLSNELSALKDELHCCTSKFPEASLRHTKLKEISEMVKNVKEHEKILIVVGIDGVSQEIIKMLKDSNTEACEYNWGKHDSKEKITEYIISKLMLYQCVIVPVGVAITDAILRHVSLIIEYEAASRETTPLAVNDDGNIGRKYVRMMVSLGNERGSDTDEFHLLVSKQIFMNSHLMEILESKYNFVLTEADFPDRDTSKSKPTKLFLADIVIDIRTCVIVKPLRLLCSQDGIRSLVNTVALLSERYQYCWILLHTTDNVYGFEGDVPVNLGRLHASLSHFSNGGNFTVQVTCCFGFEELAERIKAIAELTKSLMTLHQVGCGNKEILSYKPLIFLLSLQCFNPISANYLLEKKSLKKLFRMSLSKLKEAFPLISQKSLERFKQLCVIGTNCNDHMVPASSYFAAKPTGCHDDNSDAAIIISDDSECDGDTMEQSMYSSNNQQLKRSFFDANDNESGFNTKRPRMDENKDKNEQGCMTVPTASITTDKYRMPHRVHDLGYESISPVSLLPPRTNDRELCTNNFRLHQSGRSTC